MKRLLTFLSLILTLNLVGCSSKEETTVKDVPVTEIETSINNETLLPIQPVQSVDAKTFYAFDSVKDKIKEGFVIKAMINVKLQDVFVIKTDDAEAIKTAIETYKENDLRMFGDGYGGEENAKAVAESIIETKGDYVYFIATQNAKDIEAKILEIIE